jgi:hypothetical protein
MQTLMSITPVYRPFLRETDALHTARILRDPKPTQDIH